jgi:hypothetical protein
MKRLCVHQHIKRGTRGSVVGWGTMLQAGRQPNSFLAITLQLENPKTQFSSSALNLISWQVCVSKLSSIFLNGALFYSYFARTTQKTQPLYCWGSLFAAPLHTNWSYSVVACIFVAATMCFPSRCLAMNVYSDSTIPTFWLHVIYIINRLLSVSKSRMNKLIHCIW